MAVPAAIIAAGISAAGQGGNAIMQSVQNKKSRRWNELMYQQQRKDALADWNMQNQYNSPAQQMERLKAAGLNPNLVYGNGADAGAVGQVRSSQPGNPQFEAPQIDTNGVISAYLNTTLRGQQVDNMQAQLAIMNEEAKLKAAQTLATLMNTENTKFDLGLKSELRNTTIEAARVNLNNMLAKGDQITTQTEKIRNDIQFTIDENKRKWETQKYSIQMAAKDILLKQKQIAKTEAETQRIGKMMDYLDNQIRISGKQAEIWERGQNPNDPAWQRMLLELLQKIIKKFSGDGETPWWFPG